MEGTNPLAMTEWLSTHICHGRNQSSHHDRMSMGLIIFPWRKPRSGEHQLLPEVLELHPNQWLCQYISYLFLHHNILELHCSPLHHIPDIVILDLDVLRLVMEHWIL